MKRLMPLLILLAAMLFAGCTTRTLFGECIGLNGTEDPKFRYSYSAWNIAMGWIFAPLVFPPIVVLLDDLKCPVDMLPTN